MKFDDYVWDKEFEIKGYFADSPENINTKDSITGILHYTSLEIILELFGEFSEDNDCKIGFSKYLDKIYGFSSNGNLLILNTYGEPLGTSSIPGFPIIRYRVKNFKMYNVFYTQLDNFDSTPQGWRKLINHLEKEYVNEFKFSFEHIEEWIKKSLVTIKYGNNQTSFESAVDEYQSTKVLIKSLGINFEDAAILYSSFATKTFTSDYFIKFTSEDSKNMKFTVFHSAARKFIEFIEILSNVPISFTNIEFLVDYKLEDGKRLPLIKGKYFLQHARKFEKWKENSQKNISLSDLDDNFELILNNWYEKTEKLEFIVRQFSKNLHGDLYLEDQLVDAIKNLEVYSRGFQKFCVRQNLTDSEKQSREAIYKFIDEFIYEADKKKFKNKLSFNSRTPNLFERLEKIFDSIDESNKNKIFHKIIDKNLFIKKLVQTRNYHTHGDSKKKYPYMITSINEMYETKVLLQEVLRYFIYKELGMEYQ